MNSFKEILKLKEDLRKRIDQCQETLEEESERNTAQDLNIFGLECELSKLEVSITGMLRLLLLKGLFTKNEVSQILELIGEADELDEEEEGETTCILFPHASKWASDSSNSAIAHGF